MKRSAAVLVGRLGLVSAWLVCASCDSDGALSDTVSIFEADGSLEFGSVFVGDNLERRVGLRSTGTGPVRVLDLRFEPTGPDPFGPDLAASLEDSDPLLSASSERFVVVRWTPRTPGALSAVLRIDTDAERSASAMVSLRGLAQLEPGCDDHNPCTDERYDRAAGRCVFSDRDGGCDDGSACTEQDRCVAGMCAGVARVCDDHDVCTLDLCDPSSGCEHPADLRICDDGDPCTDDVCNPGGGCTYPHAAIGTPCGPFTCAIGHICVLGACNEISTVGFSDGFPCNDGDACTLEDACLAGECVGTGDGRPEPTIVGELHTYGGRGAALGTDGQRFVFAQGHALQVTTADGNTLVPRGRYEIPLTEPVLAPIGGPDGVFIVGGPRGLRAIDVSAPDAPREVWPTESPWFDDDSVVNPRATHLERTTNGVVALVDAFPEDGLPEPSPRYYRLTDQGALFSGVLDEQVDPALAPEVRDLAALGDVVAWVSAQSLHWVQLDGDGVVQRRAGRETPTYSPVPTFDAVAVAGERIVTLGSDGISWWTTGDPARSARCLPNAPGCEVFTAACASHATTPPSGSYLVCPNGDSDCPGDWQCQPAWFDGCPLGADCDGCVDLEAAICVPRAVGGLALVRQRLPWPLATDVAIDADWIYAATAEGILRSQDLESWMWIGDPNVEAHALRLEAGHLLTRGEIALPLRPQGVPPPPLCESDLDAMVYVVPFVPLTGPLHGDVTAVADGPPGEVVFAGPLATGRLDVRTLSILEWHVVFRSGYPRVARILDGATRRVPVDGDLEASLAALSGSVVVERVAGTPLLDVHWAFQPGFGGTVDVAGRWLWLHAISAPTSAASHLMAFDLEDPLAGGLLLEQHDVGGVWDEMLWAATRVRAADDGGVLGLATPLASDNAESDALLIRVVAPEPVHYDVLCDAVGCLPHGPDVLGSVMVQPGTFDAQPERYRFAVDQGVVLVGQEQGVQLYATRPLDDRAYPLELPLQTIDVPQIPWMAEGRAWVSYRPWGDAPAGPALAQLGYDREDHQLEFAGELELGEVVQGLYDTGDYAVVATPTRLVIVGPSCGPDPLRP